MTVGATAKTPNRNMKSNAVKDNQRLGEVLKSEKRLFILLIYCTLMPEKR